MKSHGFCHTDFVLCPSETLACIRQPLPWQESLTSSICFPGIRTSFAKQKGEIPSTLRGVLPDLLGPPSHSCSVCVWHCAGLRKALISANYVSDWQTDVLHFSVLSNAIFLSCYNHKYQSIGQEMGLRPIISGWDAQTLLGYFVTLKLSQKVKCLCKMKLICFKIKAAIYLLYLIMTWWNYMMQTLKNITEESSKEQDL